MPGRVAILKFPGTNCDEDVLFALRRTTTSLVGEVIWHRDFSLEGWDAVIVPGGFSYGDWLRAGAIAARTNAVEKIVEGALRGVPVLGICNGFQILVEAGLLPGALAPNENGRFVCRWVKLRVKRPRGPWLLLAGNGDELHMPVAHAEGRYYVDEKDYDMLFVRRTVLEYLNGWNPNGSSFNIAGVSSEDGAILGLMPHPERAVEKIMAPRGFVPGGSVIFRSLEHSLKIGW